MTPSIDPISNKPGRSMWMCVAVGLLLRLIWCLHLPVEERSLGRLPDQAEYLSLARNWLSSGTLFFHDQRFAQDVFAYRTPGYPFFIAICGGSIRLTRVVQSAIDAGTILATGLLAGRYLSRRGALIAAWIVCVNPMLIYFTGLLLGETVFTALLVWGMCLVTVNGEGAKARRGEDGREEEQDKINAFLRVPLRTFAPSRPLGFVLLALSVLIRPSAILLPIAVMITSDVRRALQGSITIAGLIALLLFPWAVRNHVRLGSWVCLTTNGGITLYDGFRPGADGASDQASVAGMTQLRTMGEVQRDAYLRRSAVKAVEANLARIPGLTLRKILRTWSPIPLSESYGSDGKTVAVAAGYTIPLFVLSVVGLCGNSLTGRAKVFLLVPAMYITVVHGLTVGSLRYRIPADVPLAVIAAGAVSPRRQTLHAPFAE